MKKWLMWLLNNLFMGYFTFFKCNDCVYSLNLLFCFHSCFMTLVGRLDPLPIVRKEDSMGFGRWEMEVRHKWYNSTSEEFSKHWLASPKNKKKNLILSFKFILLFLIPIVIWCMISSWHLFETNPKHMFVYTLYGTVYPESRMNFWTLNKFLLLLNKWRY